MEKVCVFGVPLDPDERKSTIVRKASMVERSLIEFRDPYSAIANKLSFNKELIGDLGVESWLTSFPKEEDLFMCTVENYVAFLDSDGCWEYAMLAKDFIERNVGERPSMMIAVDHSMAAASIMHSAKLYGKEDLGLIILDSHFDGILPRNRVELAQYDLEFNPETKFSPNDPFIYCRNDSFNADSFLYRLIEDGYILPENVMVVGVSDYPSGLADIDDERIQRFVKFYHSYEEKGLRIVTKEKIKANTRFFDPAKLDVGHLHVSIDIDVGSRNAVYGARFIDFKGLSENEISGLLESIRRTGKRIVSSDLCEIDIWKAGKKYSGKTDKTYEVAAKLANALLR